ncbi:hypothetical protein JR316_0004300 [Psilocybe cubensis]|uniref:Uncharacterized protein n=2 Tax=Psilocybe cubensis TaxID=181762 RepID=A0A8H7XVQ9_PSICU|nr:hypothetical protein JR316_0004300 [Psilocybe cubensis]KAH9482205.1 hypothetical protein JR316_0004300 [Psilocybe cubensis]
MASSIINETFVLANYTSSARGKSTKKYTPGVYATSTKKNSNSADGYVTVAVQADGVHVLDTSDLHPVTSQTLGPSTSFSCPPLTLPSSSNHPSRTYAIISTSPELASSDDGGRTLWVWSDDASKSKQKAKQSKVILSKDHPAFGIYASTELPERLIALSTNGEVAVVDAESLEVKSSIQQSTLSNVIHATVLPASTSPFGRGLNGSILVVASAGSSKNTHLRILAIDEADSISQEQEHELSIDSESIVNLSCSETGILSVLCTDGSLSSYRLPSGPSSSPAELSPPLRLTNLSFISQPSRYTSSILSLTSSHVLLAAVATQEVVLLLWDLQFSVLLASHSLPIPTTLNSSALHVRLVQGSQTLTKTETQAIGQAILILSSMPSSDSSESKNNKTSSVLVVVPYSVPVQSTIAAAMGKGDAGSKWLRVPGEEATAAQQSPEEKAKAKLLSTMRTAMQGGRPQAAVAAFMKWAPKPETDKNVASTLEYNFVKELLSIVLLDLSPGTKPTPGNYQPDVVRYLLEQRVVCSAMISTPGGLLGALRARDDWTSIELAFYTVLDLTESEIVETLFAVVHVHHSSVAPSSSTATTKPATEDAMDVDPPTSPQKTTQKPASYNTVPSLPVTLALLASYPTSRGPLLVAFRRYFVDAADITALLQVLETWVAKKTRADERLLPTKKDLKKTEQGVWVVVGRKGDKEKEKKRDEVPSLQKAVDLIQLLLDASFLSLLTHAPAHKILRKLQDQLNPEISFGSAAETLRGPLEPFAIAQEKTLKESLVPAQEREKEKQKGDWRQRRKELAVDVGLYKLEELVL